MLTVTDAGTDQSQGDMWPNQRVPRGTPDFSNVG
jgi:hypothetical protein